MERAILCVKGPQVDIYCNGNGDYKAFHVWKQLCVCVLIVG